MDNNLKKITDKTLNKLSQNQIILPSAYFKTFNESSKELKIDVFDDNFHLEINEILNQEYENITTFMDKTIYGIDSLSKATNEAKVAIKKQDEKELEKISQKILTLKKEILSMKKLIFVDEVTNTLNRKWIYKRLLNEETSFKEKGTIALVFINDYDTIIKKYGQNIADNILIYITKFLTKIFNEQNLNIDIAKYSENKFILVCKNQDEIFLQKLLKDIKEQISKTTLKSKSGIILKTQFEFTISTFTNNELFQTCIDTLIHKERG